jgi:hypothetical protein
MSPFARFVYVIQSDVQIDRLQVGLAEDLSTVASRCTTLEAPPHGQHRPWRMVTCVEFALRPPAM